MVEPKSKLQYFEIVERLLEDDNKSLVYNDSDIIKNKSSRILYFSFTHSTVMQVFVNNFWSVASTKCYQTFAPCFVHI